MLWIIKLYDYHSRRILFYFYAYLWRMLSHFLVHCVHFFFAFKSYNLTVKCAFCYSFNCIIAMQFGLKLLFYMLSCVECNCNFKLRRLHSKHQLRSNKQFLVYIILDMNTDCNYLSDWCRVYVVHERKLTIIW